LRGEVAVTFSSNRPERAAPGAVLFAGDRELVVEAARPHQGRMLVHFEGVDDRTAAERLLGAELTAAPLPAADVELDDDELWVHEVVGAEVVGRDGALLGRVVAVEANPAHDLLVLDGGALVPMVFVVEQRDGRLVIDPPDGLFDL
jgi:16S rRNA processing protein RimM